MHRKRPFALFTLLLLVLSACGSNLPPPRSTPGAAGADAAVERFLRAASANEYAEMGWTFGTSEGPVIQRDPLTDVERRMDALARVLQHDSYTLLPEGAVPGRSGEAVQIGVRLVNGARSYTVPFTVVRGPEGRWFVEQVAVEAVTDRR